VPARNPATPTEPLNWLALDIGGANIKVADGRGYGATEPFALWRDPERLANVLRNVIAGAPPCDQVAATMTGELADCFATKEDGVRHIVDALETAADGRPTRVYLHDGRLAVPRAAIEEPQLAAAANWHALAKYVSRFATTDSAILIDIGSTTTDIIPLVNGQPCAHGHTDIERLLSGEMVYTGVERSPVCAVVEYLPYREQWCPVAQEVFATTRDAYLVLEEVPEERDNSNTADGRPATREAAQARLARCLCADATAFSLADAVAAAEIIRSHQVAKISVALTHIIGRLIHMPETMILSGSGEFLARRVLERIQLGSRLYSLSQELGPKLSRCAPAHALAVLAMEGNQE
jgi:probable H4MPT-linked C1 transfer pathway protein